MKYFTLLFALSLLSSCGEFNSPHGVNIKAGNALKATRAKIQNNATHRYEYISFWDNRFASSTYQDSMRVTYVNNPATERGFAYHVADAEHETLYNGKDLLKIDHIKRKVITSSAAVIAEDSTFFDHKMYFMYNPREIPAWEDFEHVVDTTINGMNLLAYRTNKSNPAIDTPGDLIHEINIYYIDAAAELLRQVRRISLRNTDTIQIIDYRFRDYSFSETPYQFTDQDRQSSLGYRQISAENDEKEVRAGLVKAGQQLHRPDYPDIDGKPQKLYGKPGRKTVIMFSFIGCGGCEYALRELKKQNFEVKDELDFYLSNPVDEAAAVSKYVRHKELPFVIFTKDSRMNENFKVAAFPTFVFINEAGQVEKVLGGYDGEVERLISGN